MRSAYLTLAMLITGLTATSPPLPTSENGGVALRAAALATRDVDAARLEDDLENITGKDVDKSALAKALHQSTDKFGRVDAGELEDRYEKATGRDLDSGALEKALKKQGSWKRQNLWWSIDDSDENGEEGKGGKDFDKGKDYDKKGKGYDTEEMDYYEKRDFEGSDLLADEFGRAGGHGLDKWALGEALKKAGKGADAGRLEDFYWRQTKQHLDKKLLAIALAKWHAGGH